MTVSLRRGQVFSLSNDIVPFVKETPPGQERLDHKRWVLAMMLMEFVVAHAGRDTCLSGRALRQL